MNAYRRSDTVRMLADIGQPLLRDAIGGTADTRGDGVGVNVVVVRSDVQASITRLGNERWEVAEGGLRSQFATVVSTQHAENVAQVLQCLTRVAANRDYSLRQLVRRSVRPVLQRTGAHADQRQSMPEYIVHFASNAGSLQVPSLEDLHLSISNGSLRLLEQHRLKLPTNAHIERGNDDDDEKDRVRVRPRLRPGR